MKKLIFGLMMMTATMVALADTDYFDVWVMDPGGFAPFTYVRISATTDESYSPLSSDGTWYNGYSAAPNVRIYKQVQLDREEQWGFGIVQMDIANMNNYYFAAELLNDDGQVVAYQGYLDWGTMDLARSWLPEGYAGGAEFSNMRAAPVPEPTSGVLLLIGGALLGLRRKRRVA